MQSTSFKASALALASMVCLSACQTMGTYGTPAQATPMGEQSAAGAEQNVRLGTIVRIQPIELEGDNQLGLGAVLGAAAGGVLGHQIGSGTGQDVATVLGVIGGAMAGDVVQKKYASKKAGQTLTVRLDNGVTVMVTQETDPALQVGDRVRIDGAGVAARVRLR